MTSRERVITAIRNGIPDRVPVAPDISTYIPMKRSGLTDRDFWTDCKGNLPRWQAYLDAADYFGLDAWTATAFGLPIINEPAQAEWKSESVVDKARDAFERAVKLDPLLPTALDGVLSLKESPSPGEKVKVLLLFLQIFAIWLLGLILEEVLETLHHTVEL